MRKEIRTSKWASQPESITLSNGKPNFDPYDTKNTCTKGFKGIPFAVFLYTYLFKYSDFPLFVIKMES